MRTGILLFCLLVLLLHAAPGALAQPRSAQEIEAFSDAIFIPALDHHRLSAAQIVVVQDGQVVFERAYGDADPGTGMPMEVASTAVRIGSATKVFTATAIAQLLEDGRIASLDDTANTYLKRYQLPRRFDRDITIRDLLTHRAGFEDSAFGLGAHTEIPRPASAGEIRRSAVRAVRPPGGDVIYSNFGIAVLGLIVEDITGEAIDDYFRKHIFLPLGMRQTRLEMAISEPQDVARAYATFPNGERQRIGYIAMHPVIAPSGGIATTGGDIAKFLTAQIAGAQGQASILSPEGFREMHRRQAGNHDAVSGIGMAFLLSDWNGEAVVEHGGGWPGFQTAMLMIPDRGIGVFVSLVGEAPVAGLEEQLAGIVGPTRFTPHPAYAVQPVLSSAYVREAVLSFFLGNYGPPRKADGLFETGVFEGKYLRQRRSYTTMEAIFDILNMGYSVIGVKAEEGGRLSIRGVPGYEQVAPGLFWNPEAAPTVLGDPNSSALYAFRVENGRAVALAPQLSVDAWARAGVLSPETSGMFMLLALPFLASGVWAIFWRSNGRSDRIARFLPVAGLVALIGLPFILLAFYREGDGLMYHLIEARGGRFYLFMLVANLVGAICAAIILCAVLAWRGKWWGSRAWGTVHRVHYSLIAAASALLIAALMSVNLIGWHAP